MKHTVKHTERKNCNCKPLIWIMALALAVFGIYFLIQGFMVQIAGGLMSMERINWYAWGYYLLGLFLIMMAKLTKFKAHRCCDMHEIR